MVKVRLIIGVACTNGICLHDKMLQNRLSVSENHSELFNNVTETSPESARRYTSFLAYKDFGHFNRAD